MKLSHHGHHYHQCHHHQHLYLVICFKTLKVLIEVLFNLVFQSLGLLINLMEHSKQNIATLVQLKTDPCHESQDTSNDSMIDADGQMGSIEALMQLFIVRERASRDTDQMTNALSPEGYLLHDHIL